MSRQIAIIGCGHVGATIASNIIQNGLADDLTLIDPNEAKVQADALDFRDAMPNLDFHTTVHVNETSRLSDCDIIISALGDIEIQKIKLDRFAEVAFTSTQVKHVAKQIKASGFHGILINISNPCDIQTMIYQTLTGLPANHVIGTGTLLDSARMQRAVGEALAVDSRQVTGYNLGEHGNSQFTAWSTVRVLGQAMTDLANENDEIDLNAIDHEARIGGYHVMMGKHYTNYAIAAATTRLLNAILTDAHSVLPVSNYREALGCYLSYPAVIGRAGVIQSLNLPLTEDEQTKLAQSASFIKSRYDAIMRGDLVSASAPS